MSVSVSAQAYTFLCSVAGGIIIAFIYDIFRIVRKAVKTGNILTHAEDLLYWCIVAIVMFLTIYYSNDGELRSYLFLGTLLGVLLYALLLSKPVMKSSMFVINITVKIIMTVCRILFYPFRIIFKVVSVPAHIVFKHTGKLLGAVRQKGRNRLPMVRIWRKAFKKMRKKI